MKSISTIARPIARHALNRAHAGLAARRVPRRKRSSRVNRASFSKCKSNSSAPAVICRALPSAAQPNILWKNQALFALPVRPSSPNNETSSSLPAEFAERRPPKDRWTSTAGPSEIMAHDGARKMGVASEERAVVDPFRSDTPRSLIFFGKIRRSLRYLTPVEPEQRNLVESSGRIR
jgi:hypothetical protein